MAITPNEVYVVDVSAFLPNAPVTNDDIERILGQVGQRASRARRTTLRSNGIVSRHYAIDPDTLATTHTNAQLAADAVRGLASGDFEPDCIQCLAAGTTFADQLAPSHANMVHGELGSPPCEVVGTSGVCLAGMSAFKYAWMALATGEHGNAVASGSELVSPLLRSTTFETEARVKLEELDLRPELAFEKDFLRWMLSDGAGAVLMEPIPGPGQVSLRIDWVEILSYSGDIEACMYAGAVKQEDGRLRGWLMMDEGERAAVSAIALKQDVRLLNEYIVEYTVTRPMTTLREKHSLQGSQFDWFVPHYSSGFFRERLYQGMCQASLEIPYERWFTNLPTKGNTGSASIYIMLEELFHSGRLEPGQRILCYIPESGRFSTSFMALTVV